jgi:hypothetical protein
MRQFRRHHNSFPRSLARLWRMRCGTAAAVPALLKA